MMLASVAEIAQVAMVVFLQVPEDLLLRVKPASMDHRVGKPLAFFYRVPSVNGNKWTCKPLLISGQAISDVKSVRTYN
jgi:hypothetical protein